MNGRRLRRRLLRGRERQTAFDLILGSRPRSSPGTCSGGPQLSLRRACSPPRDAPPRLPTAILVDAAATGNSQRAHRIRTSRRSGRRRVHRELGTTGRQYHSVHSIRVCDRRKMARTAQADCSAGHSRPLFTHALGHVGKHIELGHEHQPTFALSPSALLKAGVDLHCPPSSLPW